MMVVIRDMNSWSKLGRILRVKGCWNEFFTLRVKKLVGFRLGRLDQGKGRRGQTRNSTAYFTYIYIYIYIIYIYIYIYII